MKTNTLLAAAAILAVGGLAADAQVYSQNIVGYVNQTYVANYNLVCTPLNAGVTNGANEIFSFIPDGSYLYTWNGAGYTISIYDSGGSGDPNSWFMSDYSTPTNIPVLKPGSGYFLQAAAAFTNTCVGSVALTNGASFTNSLVANYNLIGSYLPVAGALSNSVVNLGVPPDGSYLYTWNGSGYTISIFDSGGSGTPDSWFMSDYATSTNTPSISVGQGFFLQSAATYNWVQTLNIQ